MASLLKSRRTLMVAAALSLLAILPNMPAVLAQVQRVMHAFAVVNGRSVPLDVQAVTLDQARADMPFKVIAPAAIPPGLQLAIRELRSSSTLADTQLMFEYRNGASGLPALTIMESSGTGNPSTKLLLTQSINGEQPHLAPPPLPENKNGMSGSVVMIRKGGGAVTQRYQFRPITWVDGGTRVVLISGPGGPRPDQVAAIRAAMTP